MNKRLVSMKHIGFVAVVIALLALTACSGATPVAGLLGGGGGGPAAYSASDGTTPPPAISVSGMGEVFGKPDIAFIELGIDVTNEDVGAAVERANEVMNAVLAAISQQNIAEEDMQTVYFNVWPEDRYDDKGQPIGRVYHVQNTLRVKVRDIATISDVIGAGLNAGANSVNSLSFSIEDTSALEAEARQKAIADARSRAEQLADGLGVSLGAPLSVSESSGGVPIVVRDVYAVPEAAGMGGGPSISTGQLSVQVYVNISFAIGQ